MKAFLNLKLDILKSSLIYEFNLDMKQALKRSFFLWKVMVICFEARCI